MSDKTTKVTEVYRYDRHHNGSSAEVIEKLVAVGWEVEEERDDATVLVHELIPGSQRIVHTQ